MSDEPPKKRRKGGQAWTQYETDYKSGSLSLKNKKCPRCGKIMAHHQNVQRWSCGGCGYTEYIRS